MTEQQAGRGPGRPPDPAKQAAVLDAARRLFFARGPYALTMEAVAREAEVSKATVYSRFANREALIEAVVIDQQARVASALVAPPADAGAMRENLLAFCVEVLSFVVSEDVLNLQRLMASHAAAHPALGRLIYERGPRATCRQLGRWLEAMAAAGALRCHDGEAAAEALIGMLEGTLVTGLVFGARERPGAEEIRARAERAVDTFLRACGDSGRGPGGEV